jgi:hypothetical protein
MREPKPKLNGKPARTVRVSALYVDLHLLTSFTGWWQYFGGIVVTIVSLIILIIVSHHLKPTQIETNPKPTLASSIEANILGAPIPEMAKKDILELATSVPTVRLQTPSMQSSARVDDRVLRKFDEL